MKRCPRLPEADLACALYCPDGEKRLIRLFLKNTKNQLLVQASLRATGESLIFKIGIKQIA